MQKTVVTLLSTNYSGSHFLTSMLGCHSRAVYVGEVLHLRKPGEITHPACNPCDRLGRPCPLFKGVDASTIDRVYDIVFANSDPARTFVVDNSKYVRWAERFVGRSAFPMKYIHLIRDPRALVRRWWTLPHIDLYRRVRLRYKTAKRFPRYALPAIFSSQPALYKWLGQNEQITAFIRENKLDHILVTYRDLALDPAGELKRIQDWIGEPFEPAQIDYAAHDLHGSSKPEYEKKSGPLFDVRWKKDLPEGVRNGIFNHPEVRRYLGELGLRIDEDGLTRLEAPKHPVV